jgi:hypothetical protein
MQVQAHPLAIEDRAAVLEIAIRIPQPRADRGDPRVELRDRDQVRQPAGREVGDVVVEEEEPRARPMA